MSSFATRMWIGMTVLGMLCLGPAAEAKVVYVAKTGQDTNDGLSWSTARLTVQAGLNAAVSGDQVWVAAGTYVERITLASGVALYGGFTGHEASFDQRDWTANRTILDGNAAGAVVISPAGATPETRIDGFSLRNGKADRGGGIYCQTSSPSIVNNSIMGCTAGIGGGIHCEASSPVITNNTITGNIATAGGKYNGGGGICCKSSSPTITNNTITNNKATGDGLWIGGGGIYCYSSYATITNNTIVGNTGPYGGGIYCWCAFDSMIADNTIKANSATFYGGGIYCEYSSLTITHNVIAQNSSSRFGGGISCAPPHPSFSGNWPIVTNNTIAANSAVLAGGAIYCDSSSPAIANNTLAGNGAAAGGGIWCSASSTPPIANTIIAFNSSGVYSDDGAPLLRCNCVFGNLNGNYAGLVDPTGINGNISADPRLANPTYGNLHLQPASPCIDAGDDSNVSEGHTDVDRQPRIMGTHVDIGADESGGEVWPEGPPVVVRVAREGDDANDGSSWSSAKRTVQAAINAAAVMGGEVWVKAGTYNERIGLQAYVHLYGGFGGTETDRQQRDWRANAAILDGRFEGSVVTANQCGVLLSTIDGLIIRNGKAADGGGICCTGSSPTISHNSIIGSIASSSGGGIYCYSSAPLVINNTIMGNSASSGGGISCSRSNPTITNCTIAENSAGSGGGIYCTWSSPTVTNTIVAFNSSGIYTETTSLRPRSSCVYGNLRYNYAGMTDPKGKEGNICADPRFASITYGNLHIQPDSPCGDAGDDTAILANRLDIDGQARIQGSHVDIGADESDGTVWPAEAAAIVRVSPDGADSNDGSSWPLAKRTVQAGIDAASTAGGEVWVRAGTYPERITLLPGTHVYGGFAGTEAARTERDWSAHPTILDGQQAGSVVTIEAGFQISTIDGFTIRNGSAANGGGISCISSSPSIANNTITGNSASSNGGGIYCFTSYATIANNTIAGNVAAGTEIYNGGGGIYCSSSSPTITRNRITTNTATGNGTCNGGGGIYCENDSPTIANNVIMGNTALSGGGLYCHESISTIVNNNIMANNAGTGAGIYCTYSSSIIANNNISANAATGNDTSIGGGIHCVRASPKITNNTITANSARVGGGICTQACSPPISNTIVAFNSSGLHAEWGTADLRSNCVYGNLEGNYSGLPDPTGTKGNISADPRFAGSDWGNLHIQPESPCRDAGDSTVVQAGWLDMDAQTRILGTRVDIGADESEGTACPAGPYTIVRVSEQGNDANDGSSWPLAKRTVQSAIAGASQQGGEVWIAAGTYPECIALPPYVHLYGGFAGTENAKTERDWSVNRTILDGQQAGSVVTANTGFRVSTIDGLTLRNGNATHGGGIYCLGGSPSIVNSTIIGNNATATGGGIDCSFAYPIVTNNTMTENRAGTSGGGLYSSHSSPVISGNTITRNSAASNETRSGGGGIYCNFSSSTVADNTITENAAGGSGNYTGGGGIYCNESALTIVNNTIARNSAAGTGCITGGGGILSYYCAPTISNNRISDNTASSGAGIFCYSHSPLIANNPITGNHAAYDGGGIYCDSSFPIIANDTITGNTAYQGGGGIHSKSPYLTIVNTIVASNSSGILYTNWTESTLKSNCVYGNALYNYSGINDQTGFNGNISTDPRLAGVAYGNRHLLPDSPCVNAGDDAYVQTGWQDMDGQARIQGGRVDIGADESDGTLWPAGAAVIVRVKPDGDDAKDGSSWNSAKKTVQAAVDAAAMLGGDVWVQGGTYLERVTLPSCIHIFGGFAGVENSREERNWSANTTVLDGQQAGPVVTVRSGFLLNTIDGFTIRNGNAANGGGIYCEPYSSPTIVNNTVTGNSSTGTGSSEGNGGGIYCNHSFSPISNNAISGNTARISGGGIGCYYSILTIADNAITGNKNGSSAYGGGLFCQSSTPTIARNTITGNNAGYRGGGIACASSSATIIGNMIAANVARITTSRGGGISLASCTSSTIANNRIVCNSAFHYGGGIHCDASSPTIADNTIAGNTARDGGGGIYCTSSDPTIVNTIVAFNSSGIASAETTTSTLTLWYNCVYGNTAYNYSNLTDPTGTSGNISADPKFVRAWSTGLDGQWGTGDDDYGDQYLKSSSPCIDSGHNDAVPPGTVTDLAGRSRFMEGPTLTVTGYGTPPIVDIGAYEILPPVPGDLDLDDDVDVTDLAALRSCLSGQGIPRSAQCRRSDLDKDGDVDLSDFAIMQRCFSGVSVPGNRDCAE